MLGVGPQPVWVGPSPCPLFIPLALDMGDAEAGGSRGPSSQDPWLSTGVSWELRGWSLP